MTISGASLYGGVEDPESTESSVFNAVFEYTDFADQISADLVNDPPYTSLDNLNVTLSVDGTVLSINEITVGR